MCKRGLCLLRLTLQSCFSRFAPSVNGEPEYKVKIEVNQRVKMGDGVELSADIHRPDAEGKFPVILTRTPYGRQQVAAIPARRFAQ